MVKMDDNCGNGGAGHHMSCVQSGDQVAPSFCSDLPVEVRRLLCEESRIVSFSQGDVVSYGGFGRSLYIVVDGCLVTQFTSESGVSQGINFVQMGDLVNFFALYDELDSGHDETWRMNHAALAVVDTSVCAIPIEVVVEVMRGHPDFAEFLLVRALEKLRKTIECASHLHNSTAETRVRFLLDLLEDHGLRADSLTHESIAGVLGLTRVTVTRAFSKIYSPT